ncbi:bifunctional metallophosphatase/5'-nucleotidase [Chromobacterium vaccinii]|uniref:bifunctional metallophosphatase/5'-nucleotidase n=1 Tax=Chromobacterium vaccinii TaxID=1108595 RepID=UPI001E49AA0C|nr:bifunctional metallophosphatase/5'-nucleotidase [Chromobacterium vaccinii]MCD4483786.1 bifunctional metallophosphatase/5'-nucleotidase [Chromobacterium vaccinii]
MKLIPLGMTLGAALALGGCMSDSSSVGSTRTQTGDEAAAGQVAVKMIAFNDFHGNLEAPGTLAIPDPKDPSKTVKVTAGGVDYLAAWVKQLRAQLPNTVVVSAGDLIGASPLVSGMFHDEPTIEAMNLLGLDINAVGNHEFDDGQEELLRMQNGGCKPGAADTSCLYGGGFAGAKFKFLAANVQKQDGGTLFPAYEIKKYGNIPVAFIGMTLKGTPDIVAPTGIQGLSFKDEADTVNALVPKLKAQGVAAVVVVVHEGGYQSGNYNECKGISGPIVDIVKKLDKAVGLVVTGHTHQAYNCQIDGRTVTSAKNYGQLFTEINFKLSPATRTFVPGSIQAVNRPVTQDIAPLANISSLVQFYLGKAADKGNKPVGTLAGALTRSANAAGESTLGDVIADSQLAASGKKGTAVAEVAFMNPGGIRADLAPAADGSISYKQVYTVQPFGNTMMTMTLTGTQIDRLLEQQWSNPSQPRILQVSSGFRYSWSQSAPAGSKVDIDSITINGVKIDPAASYTVQVNNFIAGGGDGFTVLTEGGNRIGGGVDVDVLNDYLAGHPNLPVPALSRIVQLP